MKKVIFGVLAGMCAFGAVAADAPLWLRNVAISPDGGTVAFTYKGDIYTVPVDGGAARQITSDKAYDSYPVWSPDGSRIAFASKRAGSEDVFVIDANGGTARRLTTNSGSEQPKAWLDNETVLFAASGAPGRMAAQGPFASQIYSVKVDGSRPVMYSTIPMAAISVRPDGSLLYQDRKGYENAFRKHERSSSTGDIRLIKDGSDKLLTTFDGNDHNPVWTGDDTFVYLSEEDGTLNVYSRNLSGSDKRKLTAFTTHPVRSLSAAGNGTLAFSWNGEIYTLVPGAEPRKVEVSIVSDDYDLDLVNQLRKSGATAMAVSPTGKEVAFVIRGDVYVTSVEYSTTKRITDTPGQERQLSFSKDGRTLVYDSERDGLWQLFTATIKNPDEKQFAYATEIEETPLYSSDKPSQQPEFSPDGKKVAFLEDRTAIRVIDMDTKAVTTALDGKYNYSYADGDVEFRWSPDSRNLLASYIGVGGWNNTDIAMVAADGSQVVDLTESGYSDSNPRWALGGEAITWQSDRYGKRSHGSWGSDNDVMFMALTPEAYDKLHLTKEEAELAKEQKDKKDEGDDSSDKKDNKKDKKKKKGGKDETDDTKPAINYDLDNRFMRVERLTPRSGANGDYVLSAEGDKLYFVMADPTGKYNLMETDLREGETKVLVRGVSGGIIPDEKIENLYMISGRGMKKVSLAKGDAEDIEFEAFYDRKPSLERQYIYDHMLSQVKDKFYDADLHGVDWKAYGEAYRRFLPHIANNDDFAILLSEILGELNASHTGGRYYSGSNYSTAVLGAFFDEAYDGDGLRVAEVIAGGPLSTAKAGVKPGDVITAIDGKIITAGMDYNPLLMDKGDKRVRLDIAPADGSAARSIVVKPIEAYEQNDLLYRRWVRRNQEVVDSVSGGRIGYVHVEGMDSPSFRTVFSEMLGKYRNREAIIVDTRWNGGGWLHNDLAILLGGKEYVRFVPRGQYIGSEPFSQWTKPSVMLVNESNYSDAHGSPVVYQTLGLGDVVGAPVPGTMTAVWWENQIDPTIVFGIPQVTSMDMQGNVLENRQLKPDVVVYNDPVRVAAGIDDQLIKSVEHLLRKLDKK